MHPITHRLRRRRELQRRKSALGVAAKQRLRLERADQAAAAWPLAGLCLLRIHAAHDGRTAALEVVGQKDCTIVGTHRAMVSQLSKIITAAIRRHKARK
jgi:hypothetical protein